MKRYLIGLIVLLVGAGTSACSAPNTGGATVTPPEPTITSSSQSAYPKMGHAPDYSWIAGKVQFTKIQSGCTYIRTEEAPAPSASDAQPGTIVVGTAVRSDTSPPLRDITPMAPGQAASGPIGPSFVPGGSGWDQSQVQDGDYVVLFGHVATADEPKEMCPGGTNYITERMQLNP